MLIITFKMSRKVAHGAIWSEVMTDNVLQVGNTDRKNQKSVKIKYHGLNKVKTKKKTIAYIQSSQIIISKTAYFYVFPFEWYLILT